MSETKKYTKEQILKSEKYKKFYVLTELLDEQKEYSLKEVNEMLKLYGREV